MKTKSKLTRRQLALRLFAAALVVNGLLLLLFFPSAPNAAEKKPLPLGMIELKIKASLLTPFEEQKSVLLSQEGLRSIGPVILLKQDEETLTVALNSSLYRQYHQRLARENWVALPYLEGLLRPHHTGVSYEIAY